MDKQLHFAIVMLIYLEYKDVTNIQADLSAWRGESDKHMNKPILTNITLENFDCFEMIENIKEVDKLQKVYEGCTLDNDFSIVREKVITKLHDFPTALNYLNSVLGHNFVNFNSDCSAYEVHEYVLKCCSSDYIDLYDVPTVYILNGGFIVE